MLRYTGKKSQLEVVGLIVIVILLSLALLFYLQFSLRKEPELKKTYTTAQMTNNMVNTMLRTSTNCNAIENTLDVLIADCANDPDNRGRVECRPGVYSCEFVDSEIRKLLDETLNLWQKKYRLYSFLIEAPEPPIFDYNNDIQKCTGNIDSSDTYTIRTAGGLLGVVLLEVCVE